MNLPSINEISEQNLRKEYVKSITIESPLISELLVSWDFLGQKIVNFANFIDRKNQDTY